VTPVPSIRPRMATWKLWLWSTIILLALQFLMRNVIGSSAPPMQALDWAVAVILTPVLGLFSVVVRALVEALDRWLPRRDMER
jgi:hypothetical protein